jgi:hypothetical protein
MFAIWLESLKNSRGDNAKNLDFDHPQGWATHSKARD